MAGLIQSDCNPDPRSGVTLNLAYMRFPMLDLDVAGMLPPTDSFLLFWIGGSETGAWTLGIKLFRWRT